MHSQAYDQTIFRVICCPAENLPITIIIVGNQKNRIVFSENTCSGKCSRVYSILKRPLVFEKLMVVRSHFCLVCF